MCRHIQGADFTLGNSLFAAVKLIKNTIFVKYGIGFDARGSFPLSDYSGFGKKVIIFGADMSSSVHIDNWKIS